MIFCDEWLNAVKMLPEEARGAVVLAILEYGINGVDNAPDGSVESAILAFVKPQIDKQRSDREDNGGDFERRGTRPRVATDKPRKIDTANASTGAGDALIRSSDLAEHLKADAHWIATVSAHTSTPPDTLGALIDEFCKEVEMAEDAKGIKDARKHFVSWMRKRKHAPTEQGRPYRLMTYDQMIADKERNGRATTDAYIAVRVQGKSKPMWVTKADKEAYKIPDEIPTISQATPATPKRNEQD